MEEIVSGRELRIRSVDYTLPDAHVSGNHAPLSAFSQADPALPTSPLAITP
jgi:hypothetical protein